MKRPPIRMLELSGSPGDLGRTHGRTYAEEIRAYTRERVDLVAGGAWTGAAMTTADVLDIAESMLEPHRRFDEPLFEELVALADGAGITPAEAVIVGGFTDFVDTVRATVGGPTPAELVEDDCTAFIVPDHRADGQGFYGQTWDMHDTATDYVTLLRLQPDDAPDALVFTTTGCLGQIGMNEAGVCVGINNLTGTDGTPGVTWTSVVRAMLGCETATAALDVLLGADLAGAHNYLIFDRDGRGYNVEAMPSVQAVTELGRDPLVHTNHTIDPRTTAVQADRDRTLTASSQARLATATNLLAGNETIDEGALMELTREPDAICQVPVAPFRIESSGAAIMRPATGDFWACWGQPVHNDYLHVSLASADAGSPS